jgi:hypothetical protein
MSLDRSTRDDWTATTVNVEGDAHAPQLLDLASLAMEASQQRKFVGIQEHRRCSDRLNRPLLAGLGFDQRDVNDPGTPR